MREYIYLREAEIAPTMGSRTQVDIPIAVVDAVNTASPVLYMVHADHLSRPVRMTDAAKASVWDVVFTPWGAFHSATGAQTLNTRFPGQWFQLESGLHYNWHRLYDPTLGRYTQPDPLGFVDGPSVYAYAGNKPHTGVDRDGRISGLPSMGYFIPIPTPPPSDGGQCTASNPHGRRGGGPLAQPASWKGNVCRALVRAFGSLPGWAASLGCVLLDEATDGGPSTNGPNQPDTQGPSEEIASPDTKPFTQNETSGLKDLFGQGADGARQLLNRLEQGRTQLPQGVSRETASSIDIIRKSASIQKSPIL